MEIRFCPVLFFNKVYEMNEFAMNEAALLGRKL
jgi:hypothetical protein